MNRQEMERSYLDNLPRMEAVWRYRERSRGRDPDDEDTLQRCRGLAWQRWCKLVSQGKDPTKFASTFAWRVWSRSCLFGGAFGTGRWHRLNTVKRGCSQATCPGRQREDNPALLAQLHLDVREWRKTLTSHQDIALGMMLDGWQTKDIAARLGITWGAVSQMRGRLVKLWRAFMAQARDW